MDASLRNRLLLGLGLVVLVLAAFLPVLRNGFIAYDDGRYVAHNEMVRDGLTVSGLVWAWTSGHVSNWHPLTWMSHMFDAECFGLAPAGHHFNSLLLHLANTVLLYVLFERTTGRAGRSFVAAALFGLHPLHVESVAWVAERKDVLSTLFWLLATLAYVRYARAPSPHRLALVAGLQVAGLASKAMLVTLPFTLLLLDFWPLRRWPDRFSRPGFPWHLVREKAPLFALSLASCFVTFLVQRAGGAMGTLDRYPLPLRAANAVVSYVAYLAQTIWPSKLAVLYPFPASMPSAATLLGAAFLLGAVTVAAWSVRRSRPYALVGWLWYLGTLVPVIGLVQVGVQARANRYTYIPLIGVFLVAAWGGAEMLDALSCRLRRVGKPAFDARDPAWALVPAVVVLLALGARTRVEVGAWRDTTTLFARAMAVSGSSPVVHNILGYGLYEDGDLDAAIEHYREALRLNPQHRPTYLNLGIALRDAGRAEEAKEQLLRAIEIDRPGRAAIARTALAGILAGEGRTDSSGQSAPEHNDRGVALAGGRRLEEAIEQFSEAVRINPSFVQARTNLGRALADSGRLDEAIAQYEEALRLEPKDTAGHLNLGVALARTGRLPEAVRHYQQALETTPDSAEALNNLGSALVELRRSREALTALDRAVRIKPGYASAHYNRATALYFEARYREAWDEVHAARRLGLAVPAQFVEMLRAKAVEPAP